MSSEHLFEITCVSGCGKLASVLIFIGFLPRPIDGIFEIEQELQAQSVEFFIIWY